MDNVQWFKIRSWHVFAGVSRADNPYSRCGKIGAPGTTITDNRPGNEKTCESCLRIVSPK